MGRVVETARTPTVSDEQNDWTWSLARPYFPIGVGIFFGRAETRRERKGRGGEASNRQDSVNAMLRNPYSPSPFVPSTFFFVVCLFNSA